jgi:hypothetical protein
MVRDRWGQKVVDTFESLQDALNFANTLKYDKSVMGVFDPETRKWFNVESCAEWIDTWKPREKPGGISVNHKSDKGSSTLPSPPEAVGVVPGGRSFCFTPSENMRKFSRCSCFNTSPVMLLDHWVFATIPSVAELSPLALHPLPLPGATSLNLVAKFEP